MLHRSTVCFLVCLRLTSLRIMPLRFYIFCYCSLVLANKENQSKKGTVRYNKYYEFFTLAFYQTTTTQRDVQGD